MSSNVSAIFFRSPTEFGPLIGRISMDKALSGIRVIDMIESFDLLRARRA
jgi:hypothetical protein